MESQIHQVFVKLLDGKHRILNFNEPSISVSALKQRIQKLTSIPSHLQLLLYNNSHILHDHQTLALALSHENSPFPETTGPNSDSQLAQDQDLIRFRFTASAENLEDSAKCMEEVERSVRESVKGLMSSKRKSHAKGIESASKRVKIWMGKRKLGDSDNEDLNEDSSDDEEKKGENEKSEIIDNGSHSDSCKEAEASSGSITVEKPDAGTLDRGSSGSGSEEEDAVSEESLKSDKSLDGCCEDGNSNNKNNPVLESFVENRDHNKVVSEVRNKSHSREVDEVASAVEVGNSFTPETVQEESVPVSENFENLEKPLNFDEYHSAAELEVLGLEQLKVELQVRGLKCGGTLRERAARLFLLKTTPLEMLPKKMFAKKCTLYT
ncbi:hypothetical protein DH2020_006185 [Rehmannia glutinosa]|uniref:Ubiquitin-like domain-containing protein n=1 Tax=Rehmannia glutinosa TaxID=99300 RepID=A0ABR0XI99_REHGL